MSKAKAAPKPESGVSFPIEKDGQRSTTITGSKIIAAALKGAGTEEGIS